MSIDKELISILELPDTASEQEVAVRISEKIDYFSRLSQSAPNEFLRKTHERNLEKLKGFQTRMSPVTPSQSSSSVTAAPFLQEVLPRHSTTTQLSAIAWLIRHTENQSPVSFPLFAGANYIGRKSDPQKHCVIVDNDPFVSRMHALIEIQEFNRKAILYDDARTLGKPSKNGTYLNARSQRITSPAEIRENDTIQIGNTKFVFRYSTAPIDRMVQEVEQEDFMKTVVISML